jgi:hypothetical protein
MYETKELIMPGPTGGEFHVTGDEGVIMGLYAEGERQARAARIQEIGQATLAMPGRIAAGVGNYLGRVAHAYREDIELTVFDAVHGTNLREQRDRQAREERILRMAQKHNLIKTTYCAKHERALREVQTL